MRPPRPNGYRTAWCGSLSASDAGAAARVAGWVHRRRDHGGVIFIDLRDRSGLLQLVFHPDSAPEAHAIAHRLRPEDVLSAHGEIVRRDPANVNPELPTGEIELAVSEVTLLADADTPPFPVDEEVAVDELLRLRHRAVDLRREGMREAIVLRHRVVHAMREQLGERDFLEIETPTLTRSTPEGARDFLVPARTSGQLLRAPQSPQLFKQLLMIGASSATSRSRAAFATRTPARIRQPEFTQLDIEMSFVEEEDVIELVEAVMSQVLAIGDLEFPAPPWPRLPYSDAISRFGSDRPDTRFGLEIHDVSDAVRGSEFKVFEGVLSGGGVVRALNAGPRELSRAEQEALNDIVSPHGAKAVAPIYAGDGGTPGGHPQTPGAGARTWPSSSPPSRSPRSTPRSAPPTTTCCCSWPTAPTWPQPHWAPCASSSRSGIRWCRKAPIT